LTSGNVGRQFWTFGGEQVNEFLIGDGLRQSKGRIGNVYSRSVQRNLIESLKLDLVFWPGVWTQQPFGPGTKYYSDIEVIHMLHDLEDSSNYT
jgi:hypothetical protein